MIMCHDKDSPWFNKKTKSLIDEKLWTYKVYRKDMSNSESWTLLILSKNAALG